MKLLFFKRKTLLCKRPKHQSSLPKGVMIGVKRLF